MKLKYLDEWGISPEAESKVKKEIGIWIKEFMNRADNAEHNIKKCDFKKGELFFFTQSN